MRRMVAVALVVLAGMAIGVGSALWLARDPRFGDTVTVGPWSVDLLAGGEGAGFYTRARVAIVGLLALARTETIYFVAGSDSSGRPLDGKCRYQVSGAKLPARWWSITVYGADYFLIPNPDDRYSFGSATAPNDGAGFRFALAGPAQPQGWLPGPPGGPFYLTLRLYNPAPELARDPRTLPAPRIDRQGDCA